MSVGVGGEIRPEVIRAAGTHLIANLVRPVTVITELGSPGPKAAGEGVQTVLFGESDGAVHLMCDGRAGSHGRG